jgi:endonuclease/exonuclease/phosphatase family metal-dependent hydrolase
MRIAQLRVTHYEIVEPVKIVTINTWKCDGDYRTRMQILAGQLKALNPAIIACQECFYSDEGKADTLKFLAGKLTMNYTFLEGRFKKRQFEEKWVNSFSGLGILSTYPLAAANQFSLPEVPGDDDRKVQQAKITLSNGTKILINNTHLTHINNVPARKAQAEALADIAAANNAFSYSLICGDFNAVPGSTEISAFMNRSGAIDCYTAGEGAEPRYSLAEAFAENKKVCVDHIFALPMSVENRYPRFINSAIVLNVADKATGLYPSDHFGISTQLVIN